MTLEYSSLYGLRRLGLEYMAIREEILWVAHFANTFWSNLRGNCIVSRRAGLNKNNIRDLPLSDKLQLDFPFRGNCNLIFPSEANSISTKAIGLLVSVSKTELRHVD